MTYIEAELAEARMLLEAITSGRLRLRFGDPDEVGTTNPMNRIYEYAP